MNEFIELLKTPENYLFGYSIDININSVKIWQTTLDISTIPSGEYWFFALNKYTKQEYHAIFKKIEHIDNKCTIKIVSGIPIFSSDCKITINIPILITEPLKNIKKGKAITGKFK